MVWVCTVERKSNDNSVQKCHKLKVVDKNNRGEMQESVILEYQGDMNDFTCLMTPKITTCEMVTFSIKHLGHLRGIKTDIKL